MKRLLVLVFAGLAVAACSGSSSSSPSSPTSAGTSSLRVMLSGQVGGVAQITSGSVTLFHANSGFAIGQGITQTVDSQGATIFTNTAPGDYVVSGNADFGFLNRQIAVTINGQSNLNIVLDPQYDLRLVQVTAGGVVIKESDTVTTPTSLTFQVEVMNPGPGTITSLNGGVWSQLVLPKTLAYVQTISSLPIGEHTAIISVPGFRGCAYTEPSPLTISLPYTNNCFLQSTYLFFVYGPTANTKQKNIPFTMNYINN